MGREGGGGELGGGAVGDGSGSVVGRDRGVVKVTEVL